MSIELQFDLDRVLQGCPICGSTIMHDRINDDNMRWIIYSCHKSYVLGKDHDNGKWKILRTDHCPNVMLVVDDLKAKIDIARTTIKETIPCTCVRITELDVYDHQQCRRCEALKKIDIKEMGDVCQTS